MGKFSGVLLATDYDDTLYSTQGTISAQDRRAMDYFIGQGGLFTIATGRSYVNFAIQMDKERLPVQVPVILSNGASIYDFGSGRTLWERMLPDAVPGHVEELCQVFPQLGFEAYNGDDIYTYRANRATARHLKRCRLTGIPAAIENMPTPWLKAILQHDDMSLLEQVRDYVREHWADQYEATFSNPYLLELTAKGADKGHAVRWLAEHLGVEKKNLYCVGNGINDIPMLAAAAVPYAPSNCYEQVKQFGARLLPSCDDSCIAALIDQLDGKYH